MQLIVDIDTIDHNQVEGQVRCETIGASMAFSGWLDFIRVLEVALGAPAESQSSDACDPHNQTAGSRALEPEQPPAPASASSGRLS